MINQNLPQQPAAQPQQPIDPNATQQQQPQPAPAQAQAQDVNSTDVRPEPAIAWPEQGADLPAQMGGTRETLMPGIDTFRLPPNLAQLWVDIEAADRRPVLSNGQPNPNLNVKYKRRMLKCDKNAPLVVVGGKHDGMPMTATFSTAPRPRGRKDDPATAWISDAAYLLDVGLNDKSRPADVKVLEQTINKYGGKNVRLEHGLSGQCRPDQVRYIRVTTAEGNRDMQDPSGKKGCGMRYYTQHFKDPETGGFDTEIACECGQPTPAEAAAGAQPVLVVVRGFESVERILPPLGQDQQ